MSEKMIELIAAINIMCNQYPYRDNQVISSDVYNAIGYVFQLKSGDVVPSAQKVNEFCMNEGITSIRPKR